MEQTNLKTVVISQPMFFPWVGLFEQIILSNVYVHYDDVQLPQGRSFMTRVQIKTAQNVVWMTVPVKRNKSKELISLTEISYDHDWRTKHLKLLEHSYSKAPFKDDMLGLVRNVYDQKCRFLSELNCTAIEDVCGYFGITTQFEVSSKLEIPGKSSKRLVDIVNEFEGNIYTTGHGALNYIDYDLFEENNIRIEYMDYQKNEYPQQHGEFTPFVSILDLIACCGKEGIGHMNSGTVHWSEVTHEPN